MENKREKNLWQKIKRRIAVWLLAGATALGGYALINQGAQPTVSANNGSDGVKQNEQIKDNSIKQYELNYEISPTIKQTKGIEGAENYEELKAEMLKEIKENYIKQYNEENGTNYRAENIIFNMPIQDYIYKTENGTYITHGENPTVTKQSLISRGINFKTINNVQSYIAFLKTEEGKEVLEEIGIVNYKPVALNSNKEESNLNNYYEQIKIAERAGRGEYGSLKQAKDAFNNNQQIEERGI